MEEIGSPVLKNMGGGWPAACTSCGADLVEEHWVEVFMTGTVLETGVLPDGTLSTAVWATSPGRVRACCSSCGAFLTGASS